MQKTSRNNFFARSSASHYNRYSQINLKPQKYDKMLLTQASMNPQPRMQSVKTKLPTLRVFQSTSGQKTTVHSHAKLSKISESMNELRGKLSEVNDGFEDIKHDFLRCGTDLNGQIKQIEETLKTKVSLLDKMVNYSISEAKDRSNNLMEDCQKIKQSQRNFTELILLIKGRLNKIEHNMGTYTGQDKHFM